MHSETMEINMVSNSFRTNIYYNQTVRLIWNNAVISGQLTHKNKWEMKKFKGPSFSIDVME